jgi:hypothetical protein
MRNLLSTAVFILIIVMNGRGQKTTRISQLQPMDSARANLWGRAMLQHNIIASDFRGKIEIGNAAAERYNQLVDLWYPIGLYKHTLGGELLEFKVLNIPGEIDTDHNLHIVPTRDYRADFRRSIDTAINRMKGGDPSVDSDVEWFELGCDYQDFKEYRINEMEFEIDLHKSNAKDYFAPGKPNAPRIRSGSRKGDTVFAFGPWVSDALHCFKPEIHPAEQLWWRKTEGASTNYYLLLTCDQSDRFDDTNDFDDGELIGINRYLKSVWAPRPLKGSFAIQFGIRPRKEMLQINLSIIGSKNLTSSYDDGKNNYLVYQGDTVAVVIEPAGSDNVKVSFENLCAGINEGANGIEQMYGYVVIETVVGKNGVNNVPGEGGYAFIKARQRITPVERMPRLKDKNLIKN